MSFMYPESGPRPPSGCAASHPVGPPRDHGRGEQWKHVTPLKDFAMVQVVCRVLEGLLTPENCPPGSEKEVYEAYCQFAAIWAIGGSSAGVWIQEDGAVGDRVSSSSPAMELLLLATATARPLRARSPARSSKG